MDSLAAYLRDHHFPALFIDGLGWDHARGSAIFSVRDRSLDFHLIAQKRGVQIIVCEADRTVLRDRGTLRRFQRLVAQSWHEHILIFHSEEPRTQVWQWAIRRSDGQRVRHREHPFRSAEPPAAFLARLSNLRFALEDEDTITLLDATRRVQATLDADAELNLFAKHPIYAARSDELARAMPNGGPEAFRAFVEFHLPLARWFAKQWFRSLGIELEDAEQIAAIGLAEAARRFRLDKGCQFSTYACHWLRCTFQRYGPQMIRPIRVPVHLFWKCRSLRRKLDRLLPSGPAAVRIEEAGLEAADPKFASRYAAVQRAFAVRTLSDRREAEFHAVRRIPELDDDPEPPDMPIPIRDAIERLDEREARIIRLRFGFEGRSHSLQAIGEVEHVTRERIRQIQNRALRRLRKLLVPMAASSYSPSSASS